MNEDIDYLTVDVALGATWTVSVSFPVARGEVTEGLLTEAVHAAFAAATVVVKERAEDRA